jgi:hypothetical protein
VVYFAFASGLFRLVPAAGTDRIEALDRTTPRALSPRLRTDAGRICHGFLPLEALLLHREKSNDMVRISSRKWTFAQIEELSALIAAGSTAANAAMTLRRSITVVRAKARNLGTPFQMIAEHRRVF